MSRLRRDTVKLIKVLYRLGTKIGEAWPEGSWVYVRKGHRWRDGEWFQVGPHTRKIRGGYEFSESEMLARGIVRTGMPKMAMNAYYMDTNRK